MHSGTLAGLGTRFNCAPQLSSFLLRMAGAAEVTACCYCAAKQPRSRPSPPPPPLAAAAVAAVVVATAPFLPLSFSNLQALLDLEAAAKCHICRSVYSTPLVIKSCGHSCELGCTRGEPSINPAAKAACSHCSDSRPD